MHLQVKRAEYVAKGNVATLRNCEAEVASWDNRKARIRSNRLKDVNTFFLSRLLSAL